MKNITRKVADFLSLICSSSMLTIYKIEKKHQLLISSLKNYSLCIIVTYDWKILNQHICHFNGQRKMYHFLKPTQRNSTKKVTAFGFSFSIAFMNFRKALLNYNFLLYYKLKQILAAG